MNPTCDVCDEPAEFGVVQPAAQDGVHALCAVHLAAFANDYLASKAAPERGEPRLTTSEKAVWAAWGALPEDDKSPVKRIAKQLGMTPADVAFIVYPVEQFGRWHDEQEPDL